jgi:hypothetical protein
MKYKKYLAVNTIVRYFYSPGFSRITVRLFNTSMSFFFNPCISQKTDGFCMYNEKNGLVTTVDYVNAAALYIAADDIIHDKDIAIGRKLTIKCAAGASLVLDRKPGQDGHMESFFTIYKNNYSIPFKFNTCPIQVEENGLMVTKLIESGLGAFSLTILGYLTGINADYHLSKLGDDLERLQDEMHRNDTNAGNNSYRDNARYLANTH